MAMRLVRILILVLMVGLIPVGCTRNDGDIGDLFGTWRLIEMTADGVAQDLYSDDVKAYTWAFQSGIIRIQEIGDRMDYSDYMGTWTRDDDTLILDFTHRADYGDENFTPPAALHLVAHGITTLDLRLLGSKELHAGYRSDSGVEYVYYLKKVP